MPRQSCLPARRTRSAHILHWAGHPLLGDPKYGNEAVNRTLKQTYGIGRQLLHAWQIRQKDAASGIYRQAASLVRCRRIFRAAFYGRNTALNHIKKNVPWHSRAEARLLRQPSTSAPSAHPCGAFFSVWKRSFLYENKSGSLTVQPYRRLFIL